MSELVSILSTNDPSEAEIAKNVLEAAGIDAFVEGENQAGFSGIFEIKVVVRPEQEAAARELLND